MKIIRFMLAALLVLAFAEESQAQVEVSGSQVPELFDYAAGPLDGQGGVPDSPSHPTLAIENWNSAGDVATPGDAFVVNEENLDFGPQVTLFDPGAILGSIGRTPQLGVGGAHRRIGKGGTNTNIESNITNNFKESFTQLRLVWNGGKVGFALAGQQFDLENVNPKLLVDGTNQAGWGFTIEPDAGDPDIGILKAARFKAFAASASTESAPGDGIQLAKGDTYQVFVQAEVSNDATFMDHISVFALSESDVVDPESTVYLADLPTTSKSAFITDFNNFNMKNNLQFALHATQNFQVDNLNIGWLNGTDLANLGDDAARDPARQALVAFRTVNQKIAWKNSLGDPYVPGDTRLDGVLLGAPSNSDVTDNDINHLQQQIRLGNTSTVNYYDLDSSGVIDGADVVYLVETLWGSSMGDFDLDFDVDADDLAAWTANYGDGGGWSEGDANGNGLIDGGDLLIWQRNVIGPGSGSATTAVPEPSTGTLALLVLVGSAVGLRRSIC